MRSRQNALPLSYNPSPQNSILRICMQGLAREHSYSCTLDHCKVPLYGEALSLEHSVGGSAGGRGHWPS
jgi:hypothetical protein